MARKLAVTTVRAQKDFHMKASTRASLITAVVFFLAGGGISGWLTSDNDILNLLEVRNDIVVAFFFGGIFAAIVGAGLSLFLEKVVNQHDDA